MNDICVYFIQTYEKQISYDYYCQIMTHEVYDGFHLGENHQFSFQIIPPNVISIDFHCENQLGN
jgi:hypothetical protein